MFAAAMDQQALVWSQAPKIVGRNDIFILEADLPLMAIATRGCGDFAFLAFAQPSCGFLGVFPIRRLEAHPIAEVERDDLCHITPQRRDERGR